MIVLAHHVTLIDGEVSLEGTLIYFEIVHCATEDIGVPSRGKLPSTHEDLAVCRQGSGLEDALRLYFRVCLGDHGAIVFLKAASA